MSKLSEKRQEEEDANTKPGPRWLWVGLVLVVVVAAWAGYYFLYFQKPVSVLDGFAQCLNAKGARMYGAWWCPHCAEQKEMFGLAFHYVNYVECSPPGLKTMNDVCKQAGVKGYPTWQFSDGSSAEGPQPLNVLGEKTGCKLP
jgi:hypothetical protein